TCPPTATAFETPHKARPPTSHHMGRRPKHTRKGPTMFTVWGSKQRFCDGMTRRDFLKIGAFGASLALPDLLKLQAAAQTPATSKKAAIMISLPGGPSHIDMYDLKPNAPAEFRGEFKPINTNVPGVQICEHFPRQAQMWDKLACIRSLIAAPEHSDH